MAAAAKSNNAAGESHSHMALPSNLGYQDNLRPLAAPLRLSHSYSYNNCG